jgi:hypothetical protein
VWVWYCAALRVDLLPLTDRGQKDLSGHIIGYLSSEPTSDIAMDLRKVAVKDPREPFGFMPRSPDQRGIVRQRIRAFRAATHQWRPVGETDAVTLYSSAADGSLHAGGRWRTLPSAVPARYLVGRDEDLGRLPTRLH